MATQPVTGFALVEFMPNHEGRTRTAGEYVNVKDHKDYNEHLAALEKAIESGTDGQLKWPAGVSKVGMTQQITKVFGPENFHIMIHLEADSTEDLKSACSWLEGFCHVGGFHTTS